MCTEKRNTTLRRKTQSLQGSISWNCASSSTQVYIYLTCKRFEEIDQASETARMCCEAITKKGNSTPTAGPGITFICMMSHRQLWMKKEKTLGRAVRVAGEACNGEERSRQRANSSTIATASHVLRAPCSIPSQPQSHFPVFSSLNVFQPFLSFAPLLTYTLLVKDDNLGFWKYCVCVVQSN